MRCFLLAVTLLAAILSPGLSWVKAQDDSPVILELGITDFPDTLDPQMVTRSADRTYIENLFVGLTDLNPFTGEITPELATSWDVDEDATVWTFHLRSDVNWVRYDSETEAAEVIRPVTAEDVVYGIQRACDPRLNPGSPNVNDSVINIIQGCREVFDDPNADDALVRGDTIGVAVLDNTTVQIQLTEPAGYFLSMTVLPVLRPVYREAIEEHGDKWSDVENFVTNGPYTLVEYNERRMTFERNRAYPEALWHGGNIDQVYNFLIDDGGTIFALYQENQLDRSPLFLSESGPLVDYDALGFVKIEQAVIYYFGYDHSRPPFDNVHVRRAFSAIIDRNMFISQILRGRGNPNEQLLPSHLQLSANIVGFDPEYAQQQLALAGYPNCDGLPPITFYSYLGAGNWGEFWAASAEEHLGCSTEIIQVQEFEFSELLETIDSAASDGERPKVWTFGWGENYPDPYNWYIDSGIVTCGAESDSLRKCSEVDDWIREAMQIVEPEREAILYRQIEEALFGPEGEFPVAPIFASTKDIFVANWYTGPFETEVAYYGQHWDAYSIDMEAKLAAREK